jgi:hypothetical protein
VIQLSRPEAKTQEYVGPHRYAPIKAYGAGPEFRRFKDDLHAQFSNRLAWSDTQALRASLKDNLQNPRSRGALYTEGRAWYLAGATPL